MKPISIKEKRLISSVIPENRERELRLNLLPSNEDHIKETDMILKNNQYDIGPNSRYEKLKKIHKSNDENKRLIANQEILQFLQIAKHISMEPEWRSDILMSFTNDPSIPRKDSRHTPGKDKQFELYLAARFKKANISVIRDEPDLVCKIKNYTFTVAAKRIKSRKQLFKRIKEARKQIIKAKKPGIIALDISPLQKTYQTPYQIIAIPEFQKAAIEFLDIEFESKFSRIEKLTKNNKIFGIIAFSTFCAKHSNQHTNLIGEFHNGKRLCKPYTEKANIMWQIVDQLSNSNKP